MNTYEITAHTLAIIASVYGLLLLSIGEVETIFQQQYFTLLEIKWLLLAIFFELLAFNLKIFPKLK